MENNQIWLKPKPTHIDEYFEDFLSYLKLCNNKLDTLFLESIRLLRERVKLLIDERTSATIYRQTKDTEVLKFNIRLCGAWLLSIKDADSQEQKQVLLTLINNLITLIYHSKAKVINQSSFAYNNLPKFIDFAMKLATHAMPMALPFIWTDLIDFKLDLFIHKFININFLTTIESYYEDCGCFITKQGEVRLTNYSKYHYDKIYSHNDKYATDLLPTYKFRVSANKDIVIKESQKEDVEAIENFVQELIRSMRNTNTVHAENRLLDYTDGELAPVEIIELGFDWIRVKTIDKRYNTIEGYLVLEDTLKAFSKFYPISIWTREMHVGQRFNTHINVSNRTFSITRLFVDFVKESAKIGEQFNAHNRIVDNQLELREFWLDNGIMAFVNITAEEHEQLVNNNGYAGIEIDKHGEFKFRGCVYGHICDFDVDYPDFTRDSIRPTLICDFLETISEVETSTEQSSIERMSMPFVKEYCRTLNILQRHEVNPMMRYRMICTIRILCNLMNNQADDRYFAYIGQYLKTLIRFAKAEQDEWKIINPINAPDDLKDEEAVTHGRDILNILSCFARGYEETNSTLDAYIDADNEMLSTTASLVQSYNRLSNILEDKTLRGIKKQILNHLSVVIEGDSTLELSSELEGIYGEEDEMKEFKTSFFEAPSNAKEQRQYHNIFRSVCAMMNNRGGVVYLGVNDNGVPVGIKNDLETLQRKYKKQPTMDAYKLYINKLGDDWLGEAQWKYVTLKPITEHNVLSIVVEPYPYDLVCLKDGSTFLRKNNASAPITDDNTKADIRRRRLENLRKSDDAIINLQDAIQKKQRVWLMGYRSSNSGTITNRRIEPFHIDDNEYLHAYEPESKMIKIYRISRADRIAPTTDPWQNSDQHIRRTLDPFHMTGDATTRVVMDMRLPAKNALEEFYPKTKNCIRQIKNDTWRLEVDAYTLNPIVAFYISHAQHIEIVDGEELKEKVREYIQTYLNI